MAKNSPDCIQCGKRTGPTHALLCEACEGRCPICESRMLTDVPAFLCGDCAFGEMKEKCIICSAPAKFPAYYCRECVLLGRDRDGCARILTIGLSQNDRAFERKRSVVPSTS